MPTSDHSLSIIRRHTVLSAVAGSVPVAGVDMAASAAVQVRMIRDLAQAYGVPFESGRARAVTLAVVSAAAGFSHGIPKWMVSGFPALTPVGWVLKPFYVAALTWGLGSMLTLHFERGGALADFNPLPGDIRASVSRGLDVARDWLRGGSRASADAASGTSSGPIDKSAPHAAATQQAPA